MTALQLLMPNCSISTKGLSPCVPMQILWQKSLQKIILAITCSQLWPNNRASLTHNSLHCCGILMQATYRIWRRIQCYDRHYTVILQEHFWLRSSFEKTSARNTHASEVLPGCKLNDLIWILIHRKPHNSSYLTQNKANYWDWVFCTPYIVSGNNRDGVTL